MEKEPVRILTLFLCNGTKKHREPHGERGYHLKYLFNFLDPRRTAGSIAIMCGFHLLLTYLDCRSVHLSEILVVCGDCLGKYVYIEFFFKIRV